MVGFVKIGDKLLCNRCGYLWKPRSLDPKSCPRCKRRKDYDSWEDKAL